MGGFDCYLFVCWAGGRTINQRRAGRNNNAVIIKKKAGIRRVTDEGNMHLRCGGKRRPASNKASPSLFPQRRFSLSGTEEGTIFFFGGGDVL